MKRRRPARRPLSRGTRPPASRAARAGRNLRPWRVAGVAAAGALVTGTIWLVVWGLTI